MDSPRLAGITVYPVKSLDGTQVESASLTDQGGLEDDRRYALFDESGAVVNGKREPRLHRVGLEFDLERRRLSIRTVEDPPTAARCFVLPADLDALSDWFGDYLGYGVSVRSESNGGFPDDTANPGPTVISTATIETVAGWFDDVAPEELRRRLRPSLEVDGVEAFWEDRLYADHGEVVRFTVGDATLEGVNPCQRCAVPARDPDTGESTPGFRERFVDRRRATRPPWTSGSRYDHDYRLMVNTRLHGSPTPIEVGDWVEIRGIHPE